MTIPGIAKFGACLLIPVVGASSQTFRPVYPTLNEPLIAPVDPPLRSEAAQHDLQLAGDYMAGRGVPKSAESAAYWYKKAADSGDPSAQTMLGFLYLTGVGVQPDDVEAFKWFARASGSGYQPAKLNLAVMYMQGQGVARDAALGVHMLQDLAAKRNSMAEDYLGIAYYTGMGVNIDHSLAAKWFARAARQHNAEGEFDMGLLESSTADQPRDLARAAAYFRSSAHAGFVPAMHSLGLVLVYHPELPQKPDEAEKALVTASRAGYWRSSVLLGIMARDGKGRTADKAEAFRWFLIAAGQGGAEAEKLVAHDLDEGRAALDAAVQAQQKQQADAWVKQYGAKITFVFGDRFRNQAFPLAEIREPLSLTTLN